jgi:cephalosporin hydroxylase
MSLKYTEDSLQHPAEITAFCELLTSEGARSYLEIGSKYGGSLWRVANALPAGSRIVSVDLPGVTKVESEQSLTACVEELRRRGYDVHLIWGDSTEPKVIDQVTALGPFDAMLLDGDHRLAGISKDWEAYGPLGRIVAFHDVAWMRAATWQGLRIDVPLIWNHLRVQYRSVEFRHDETRKNNGIGVLWRG